MRLPVLRLRWRCRLFALTEPRLRRLVLRFFCWEPHSMKLPFMWWCLQCCVWLCARGCGFLFVWKDRGVRRTLQCFSDFGFGFSYASGRLHLLPRFAGCVILRAFYFVGPFCLSGCAPFSPWGIAVRSIRLELVLLLWRAKRRPLCSPSFSQSVRVRLLLQAV